MAAGKNVQEFNELNFDQEVLKSETSRFWSISRRPGAAHVRRSRRWSGQLADEFAGKVKVGTIDIDDSPGIAQRFGIRGVPTLYVFKGGEVVGKMVGAAPKQNIAAADAARAVSAHRQSRPTGDCGAGQKRTCACTNTCMSATPWIALLEGDASAAEAALAALGHRPAHPWSRPARTLTRVTGATTSWAMRSPGSMVAGALPRLTSNTCSSPR